MKTGGLFVVSLDFELLWGVLDKSWRDSYRANVRGGRLAIPKTLELFRTYGIRATWATVGLAMCEGRDEAMERLGSLGDRAVAPGESLRAYIAEHVGRDEAADPWHFAPSLVRTVAETPGQEIGTHTFSHYHCMESGASLESFRADLAAAASVARARGVDFRALVLPRNQVDAEYLGAALEAGVACYRGTPAGSRMYASRSEQDQGGFTRALRLADAYLPIARGLDWEIERSGPFPSAAPTDVPASRFLRPCLPGTGRLESLRAARIAAELDRAALAGRAYHLWWHPHNFGAETERNLGTLERVLEAFAKARERHGMRSATMSEAAAVREGGNTQ